MVLGCFAYIFVAFQCPQEDAPHHYGKSIYSSGKAANADSLKIIHEE